MQKQIRILYDYSIFIMQKYGGVSRYFSELYLALKDNDKVSIDIFTDYSCNQYTASIFHKKSKNISKIGKKIELLFYAILTVIRIVDAEIKKNGYDIIHCTWYSAGYIKVLRFVLGKRCPKVIITIHDLIPFIFDYKKLRRITVRMDKAIRVSDGIICVSNNTKSDLLRYFPELYNRDVPVVYHGTSIKEGDGSGKFAIDKEYVLFVGKRANYKNFIVLVEAISELARAGKLIEAICVGGGGFTEEEKKQLNKMKVADLFSQIDADDSELAMLYVNARCFVYSSNYEGFGIPILEAFKLECPVILSRASCFPEIADDAALYFEVDNYKELARNIEEVLENDSLREKLIMAGKRRLEMFSWEKSANVTLDYYSHLLGR